MARPLLYLGSRLSGKKNKNALHGAISLWGVAFNDITKSRRRNILRQTDPKMESLLDNLDNFKESERNLLFGSTFLNAMV
jgi:hypothetical protein